MAFVANHNDFVILIIEAGYFFMDFGYQRAGSIKNAETTLRRFFLYGFRYAVSRVNCFFVQQTVYYQANCANADKAVGNVKCGVEPVLPIEKQKIDNVAVNQTVNHIANRAADNHGSP
ncbi:Uncharacterised protein [Mycobacteroides abscessus subsp. massiliense]|nr:Uncharacterised protein [Mycobacteroides abscessus subsp. massiliense]